MAKVLVRDNDKQPGEAASRRRKESGRHTVARLARVFRMLGEDTRLRIVLALGQMGEMHVRALCDLLDESQPAVSHHLALLRSAGVLERRRDGKHNYYRLKSRALSQLAGELLDALPRQETPVQVGRYTLSRRSG